MPLPLQRLPPTLWDDSLFETVVAAAINGVMAVNDHGLVSVFNAACETMFQYRPEEVLGHGVAMLLASPFREEYEERLKRFQQTGRAEGAGTGRELRGRRKDGTEFPIFMSVGEGVHDGRRMFVVVVQDLTDMQMERAMHAEQRAFLAAIVDSSNDAIVSKTLDGKIMSWNRAAEHLFGYSAAEMIGTPITRLFPEDRVDEEAEIMARIREGLATEHYETVRLRKDGGHVDVSVTVSPIRDSNGAVIGASKTVRDISERKLAEARLETLSAELSHVARVSEMGQVSAAIAHELNQPLTAVLNYTNVAKRLIAMSDPAAKAKSYEAVSKAGEQALRAGQIIRRLRDFVEKRESTRTLEDINAVTDDSLALGLIGTRKTEITTIINFTDDLQLVLIDKVQIQQVLVNLLRNATEAMAQSERRELTVTTTAVNGDGVQVSVADTGCGVPDELAERLFRPFVTTKSSGMGIGLAISRSIVEAHGGRLTMVPNPGGGTIFQFILPVAKRVVD
jgi:two-component system, LuxR family, sensor kinase FixL